MAAFYIALIPSKAVKLFYNPIVDPPPIDRSTGIIRKNGIDLIRGQVQRLKNSLVSWYSIEGQVRLFQDWRRDSFA